MKTHIAQLKSIGACEKSIEWAEKFDSGEEAWKACDRYDWIEWVVDRLELRNAAYDEARRVCDAACDEAWRVYEAAYAEAGRVFDAARDEAGWVYCEAMRAAVSWSVVEAKLNHAKE